MRKLNSEIRNLAKLLISFLSYRPLHREPVSQLTREGHVLLLPFDLTLIFSKCHINKGLQVSKLWFSTASYHLPIGAFLCTIYLYFAVTLGATDTCSGMTGTQKATCKLQHARSTLSRGKLKFF
ncbi:hypothetical protein V6N12_062652 [Hibiscus sabdariffa]|uniref:Uncharacterized protein n=1 Tax=Hibiscus sabdariffa TaxID=183260 RepID=A0ABR2F9H0_9ROSI